MKKDYLFIIILIAFIGVILAVAYFETKPEESPYNSYGDVPSTEIWLATDMHYIAPELTDGGTFYQKMVNTGDGKYMYGCEEIIDAFVEKVIDEHPDALILSGDLTFNGAKVSHLAFAKKLEPIKEAGISVIALPGNHDLTVNRAAKFSGDSYELVDSIDASEFLEIYGDYGRNDAIAVDDSSLSYVAQVADNVRVLVVDVNTVPGLSGILTKETLAFVEEQLQKAQEDKTYVIGVTHQPSLVHSELTSQGMSFINDDKLIALYEKYNVLVNLSGHMHIQHIKENENGFTDIATGALMTSPNYYAEININRRQLTYEAIPVLDDSDIGQKAKEFLWQNSYRQGMEQLDGVGNKEKLAGYFADFNTNYIAGRMDLIPWDEQLTEEWGKTDSFVPTYFELVQKEIAKSKLSEYQKFHIKF